MGGEQLDNAGALQVCKVQWERCGAALDVRYVHLLRRGREMLFTGCLMCVNEYTK
jgi:hypothetical protein